jgi:uncharacterized protein YcfL
MKQVLIAVDQLFNTLIGGMADETLSASAWRNRNKHSLYKVIDALFFWDRQGVKRHCQLSYESELLRQQLPKAYRRTSSP